MINKNLLLCGCGTIGQILYADFKQMAEKMNGECLVYDPIKFNQTDDVLKYDFQAAFVCVPTPSLQDGSCDNSVVLDVISKIKAEVIVIKSTISLDIIPELSKYNNVIFSPEYTSNNQHKGVQNFVVLGGERKLCNKVAELYRLIKTADFEIVYTDIKTAILAKYMINCYLAMKVAFCSEFYLACEMSGVEYDDVRNIFIKDSRVNPSHTNIIGNKAYYDSHCLNKDIPAFVKMFESNKNIFLMKEVDKINNVRKGKLKKNEMLELLENELIRYRKIFLKDKEENFKYNRFLTSINCHIEDIENWQY